MAVEVDSEVQNVTLEALAADMPETAPRYYTSFCFLLISWAQLRCLFLQAHSQR